ncbi:amidohydrolase [Bullifex sp.]|uniref:M20 metallopeptidase family protein n=2 Tax=Bullifex TaxID=2815782 RepID=UPI002A8221AA|nr:amidohydrolase [Bullifex sp.]MDY4067210.1 amidohydrolase [Bullifex sp.]
MSYSIETIKQEVLEDRDYLVSLRRYLHTHPELPREEYETAKFIEEELNKIGLNPRRVGETGVYALLEGSKPGKALILRADIDALPITETHECSYKSVNPGKMHACGHDAHTACLLEAARILVKHKEDIKGSIAFCFQQAEEIGYGANIFVGEGLVKGDRCFGIHLASNILAGKVSATAGPNNASVDYFKIKVNGACAHVSTPELGVDAAYIASMITVGAQGLVTRRTNPTDSVIIGIGKIVAGTAYNIVAGEAVLEGTIRVMYPEIRSKVKSELKELAENTAKLYGGSAEIEYQDFTAPLINPEIPSKEVAEVAAKLFGRDNVITNRPYSLGGDDFAEFILEVPGCYAYVGSGNPEIKETTLAHHDSSFDIDEKSLEVATTLHVAYALEYLNDNI